MTRNDLTACSSHTSSSGLKTGWSELQSVNLISLILFFSNKKQLSDLIFEFLKRLVSFASGLPNKIPLIDVHDCNTNRDRKTKMNRYPCILLFIYLMSLMSSSRDFILGTISSVFVIPIPPAISISFPVHSMCSIGFSTK